MSRQIRDVRTRLDLAAREAVRRTARPFCDQRRGSNYSEISPDPSDQNRTDPIHARSVTPSSNLGHPRHDQRPPSFYPIPPQTRRRRPCITATLLPVTHDLAPRCELLRWNRCYAQRKQNRITGIASYQRRRPGQGQPRHRANQRQGCTPARNYCRHGGARGKITAPHDSRGRAEHQETNLRAR